MESGRSVAVFEDDDGAWRWEYTDTDGLLLATGPWHMSSDDAVDQLRVVLRAVLEDVWPLVEMRTQLRWRKEG